MPINKTSLAEYVNNGYQLNNPKKEDKENKTSAAAQRALSKAASSSKGSNETIPAVLGSQESLNRSDSPSQPTKDPRTLALNATMEDLKNQLDGIKAEDPKKQVTLKYSGTESKPLEVVHDKGKAYILISQKIWNPNRQKSINKTTLIDPTNREEIKALLKSKIPLGLTMTDLNEQLSKLRPGKVGQTITLKYGTEISRPIVVVYDNKMNPQLEVLNFSSDDDSRGLFRLETLVSPDDIRSISNLAKNIRFI